jgi:hypothetical protein
MTDQMTDRLVQERPERPKAPVVPMRQKEKED